MFKKKFILLIFLFLLFGCVKYSDKVNEVIDKNFPEKITIYDFDYGMKLQKKRSSTAARFGDRASRHCKKYNKKANLIFVNFTNKYHEAYECSN